MSLILSIQGWFYVVTGLWPLISIRSFERVTGPKKDHWLVKTVGLMIASSGVIFIMFNQERAALVLAIMNALLLAAVDIHYVVGRVISRIYLLDAVVELGLVGLYVVLILQK